MVHLGRILLNVLREHNFNRGSYEKLAKKTWFGQNETGGPLNNTQKPFPRNQQSCSLCHVLQYLLSLECLRTIWMLNGEPFALCVWFIIIIVIIIIIIILGGRGLF